MESKMEKLESHKDILPSANPDDITVYRGNPMNQITYKRTKNGVSVTSVVTDYLDTMAIWKAIDSPFFLWTSESEKINIVFCETKKGMEDGLGCIWIYLPYKCSKRIGITSGNGDIVAEFNDKIIAVFDEFNRNNDANYIKRVKTDPRDKYFSSAKMAVMEEWDKQNSYDEKCGSLDWACHDLCDQISVDGMVEVAFMMDVIMLKSQDLVKQSQERFIEKMVKKLHIDLDNKNRDNKK